MIAKFATERLSLLNEYLFKAYAFELSGSDRVPFFVVVAGHSASVSPSPVGRSVGRSVGR